MLGLSITVCISLGVNSAPFIKHFLVQPEILSVNKPRPIAAAMEMLERKYGVIITYEDAPYIHETDVEDQTSPAWRQSHPNGPRALIPKRGHLEITYQISPGPIKSNDIRLVVQKLLDTHADKNNPGRFRLLQEGEMLHIIPMQVRDSSGYFVSIDSILDTTISFPAQERKVSTTLKLITNTVSQVKGVKFVIGMAPLNLLDRTSFNRGANNEKARDVLISALKTTNSKLSWRIFYDPGMKWYILNLHAIEKRRN
jgi:hypothetical protein